MTYIDITNVVTYRRMWRVDMGYSGFHKRL